MRINKYLAQNGYASRREIDKLIESGDIKVNGKEIMQGQKVTDNDKIFIKGKLFEKPKSENKVYFLLNKPRGVLSAAKDDRGRKTVVDLIDTNERLYPIGRLDSETEGAIILTNDGDVFNKVIHPKGEVYKEYFAILKGEIKDKDLSRVAKGVILDDGPTLPAKTKILKRAQGRSEVIISIREGKNRQVRRMFDAVKHPVVYLRREAIGKINLGKLELGQYRKLTSQEINYLKSL
ncbi:MULTISPECIES: pseudouridine synthase [Cetobacterium]|uniref:Pseudouridine synthase n=1 Tax=Candidatus Cetobacterium colombiensis TaxID=3073100 RepID=A0ABU4W8E2_9FUSO|nr:pseudouridine synthase [Candidatus Cetobacterium colombiensis]MDX8335772.1 pseudouridine synthase [Candidatus Cetobacterium colombiensis]